ncbi:MAG: hypothetical protein AB1505_35455 [Candidatus Latescibacterota bacterium]
MSQVLYVTDPVVTGEQLRRLHQGQAEVCFAPRTVVTPTAWDYVRQARLAVSRGEASADAGAAPPAAAASGSGGSSPTIQPVSPAVSGTSPPQASGLIPEVCPAQLVAQGRCDHPDQPCGCTTDEFGSGYADGAARAGRGSGGGPATEGDVEALVQRITDLVMEELRRTRP